MVLMKFYEGVIIRLLVLFSQHIVLSDADDDDRIFVGTYFIFFPHFEREEAYFLGI